MALYSIKHLPTKPITASGFSLLELIIVIVLIGIMAVSLGNLTTSTVYSYVDAKDRNRLSQSAKWLSEKISREVREALPQSVRAGSNGNFHCLEFLPINNSSSYLNFPASGSVTSFNAVGYNLLNSNATLIAIMPIDANSVYNSSGTLGIVNNIQTFVGDPNQVVITLNAATTFSQRSPQQRFYLLNNPVSYCLNNNSGQMFRYDNYNLNPSQQFPPSGGDLIGENLSATSTVFNYSSNTLSRSGLLQINLHTQNRSRSLTGNQESFDVFHEVHIRNVP